MEETRHPWHEKTQDKVAQRVQITDPNLQAFFNELLNADRIKREAALDTLYRQTKELDPAQHGDYIMQVASLLLQIGEKCEVNPLNLQAGTLIKLVSS